MAPPKDEKLPAEAAAAESDPKSQAPEVESDNEEEEPEGAAGASDKKKKKKKKSKKKKAGASDEGASDAQQQVGSKLSAAQLQQLLALNPALSNELGEGSTTPGNKNVVEMLRRMNLEEILTGLPSGPSVKDMGAFKFWKTQPVPKFDEEVKEEGPMQVKTVDEVAKEPSPLPDGFEWVTMDLTSDEEMTEVHNLLEGHYVEDDTAMLRFNYSLSILNW